MPEAGTFDHGFRLYVHEIPWAAGAVRKNARIPVRANQGSVCIHSAMVFDGGGAVLQHHSLVRPQPFNGFPAGSRSLLFLVRWGGVKSLARALHGRTVGGGVLL